MKYSDFSMYSLMADENQKWHYVVGMYLGADNKVCLDAKLYKVADNGTETAFASCVLDVETLGEGVTRSGYIVVHSALKGGKQWVGDYYYNTFTYTAPYAGNASTRA